MKKIDIDILITQWSDANIVSPEQAARMRDDVAAYTSEKSGKKFISAIMYIGATALSLGALLLIASNWAGLSKGMKLLLTVLLPVIPVSFAYYQMIVRESKRTLGRSASILGMVLIGGSLALIGQIYHLEPNMVSFLWLWFILAAPLTIVFKTIEAVFFSVTMLGVTLFVTLIDFFQNTHIDDSPAVMILTIAAGLYAYVLYTIGRHLRNSLTWPKTGRMLRLAGAGLAITTLFITTFEFYARLITGTEGYYNRSSGAWEPVSIGLNLIFIGFLVFALLRALKFEEYAFAFSIVRLFGLYLLVKYFTLFYSMLDTGIFFVVGGVLFITGGWLLENRKEQFLAYMKRVNHTENSF